MPSSEIGRQNIPYIRMVVKAWRLSNLDGKEFDGALCDRISSTMSLNISTSPKDKNETHRFDVAKMAEVSLGKEAFYGAGGCCADRLI